VTFTFRSQNLSYENWVVDFGALKSLKGWVEDWFDHKTLVAEDDPHISTFRDMQARGMIEMRELPHVGMEAFAMYIYHFAEQWLIDNGFNHATLECVEVKEHESNFARYRRNS